MALKNILSTDISREIRAIMVDNLLQIPMTGGFFGGSIDSMVKAMVARFTENAKGYKIEDNGAFVGYYVVDFGPTSGVPYMADYNVRQIFRSNETYVNSLYQQIQLWTSKEFPLVISSFPPAP